MSHNTKLSRIVICCLLVFASYSLNTYADLKADADKILIEIKKYDFGQSREALTQFSELLRSAYDSPADLKQIEESMLAFLKSEATFAAKQFICKELSVIGTEAAVPTLAPMLKDPQTVDIALYALERIPGEKVDATLLKTLPNVKGKVKVGIINTLGQRRTAAAVKDLEKLIYDKDKMVAEAAAAALGKIANQAAAAILAKAKDKTTDQVQVTVLDAYLLCADQLMAEGKSKAAAQIYNELFTTQWPFPIRSAALRGLVKTGGDEAGGIIIKALQADEPKLQAVAIDLIRELPEGLDLSPITAEFGKLAPLASVQFLTALADRGDSATRETVVKATTDESPEVRMTALKALVTLGNAADVELLAKVAASGSEEEKETARASLGRLRGQDIDQKILASIPVAETDVKVELISSVGARMIAGVEPTLLKVATDPERTVRLEAFKSLGQVAEPRYIPDLIDLLEKAQSEADRKAAEKAIVAVARRVPDQNNQAKDVLARLPEVQDLNAKTSLLQVAGRIGDLNALPVLREALKNKNNDIQIAAIQALSDWPTPEPMPDLLKIAQTAKDEVHQVLALRGFIHLNGLESERPTEEVLKEYQTAMNLAQNANEKRLILSGLSNIEAVAALEMVAKHLDDSEIQEEAAAAIVKIGWRTRHNAPELTKKLLTRVLEITKNEQTSKDAQGIIERIEER